MMWELEFQSHEQVEAGQTGSVLYMAHWNEFVNAQSAMWPGAGGWLTHLRSDLETCATETERTGRSTRFQFRSGLINAALVTVNRV